MPHQAVLSNSCTVEFFRSSCSSSFWLDSAKTTMVSPLLILVVVSAAVALSTNTVWPETIAQVQNTIKYANAHKFAVSIVGAGYSMGGQTEYNNSVHFDLKKMNKILKLDTCSKTIQVQAGATWRQVQEAIDPFQLSVQIMQSYNSFSIGGSLSVNAHGRYIGHGALISSVSSFRIVLANAMCIIANRTFNADIFYSAIGGYGLIGVIVDVTLHLVPNSVIQRQVHTVPFDKFEHTFRDSVWRHPRAVLFNADWPREDDWRPDLPLDRPLTKLVMTTWYSVENANPGSDRLMTANQSTILASKDLGSAQRTNAQRPKWRNWEASYSVDSLNMFKPYALQEFFLPYGALTSFLLKMQDVTRNVSVVKVLNISIRHAIQDQGSVLAWCRWSECWTIVLFYNLKQNSEQNGTQAWVRSLIDLALDHQGTFYMPYHLHATREQVQRGYPKLDQFLSLKSKVDPFNCFRNSLLGLFQS